MEELANLEDRTALILVLMDWVVTWLAQGESCVTIASPPVSIVLFLFQRPWGCALATAGKGAT